MDSLKLIALLLLAVGTSHCKDDLYSIEVTTIEGEKTTLTEYKNKVSESEVNFS